MTLPIAAGEQVVIFDWSGLGDHVLTWPALRAIATRLPGQVSLLEGPGRQCILFRDVPFLERRAVSLSRTLENGIDVAASLQTAGTCDVFISLAHWLNQSVFDLAYGMGASRVICPFEPSPEVVPFHADRHMFRNAFAFAEALFSGVCFEDYAGPPVFSPAAVDAAKAMVQAALRPGDKLLYLHPETKANKQWTKAGFSAALGLFLAARPDYKVLVSTSDPFPLELGELAGRVWAPQPHLELGLALIAHADLFLGVDSVCKHIADLYRTPGVALFGPESNPEWWGFSLSPRGKTLVCDSLARLSPERVCAALLEAAA